MNLALFSPLVGDGFDLHLPEGGSLQLLLAEARDLGPRPLGSAGERSFSLIFRSSHSGHRPQGTYRLKHPQLGSFELFLVPIGPDAQGSMRYEAIFN
jgi:hypothetical protein